VKASAEPIPGLFHSDTNQAKPAALSSGPKRLLGRRHQNASPQPISAHPATRNATPAIVERRANE
jgi:hypothetical protein